MKMNPVAVNFEVQISLMRRQFNNHAAGASRQVAEAVQLQEQHINTVSQRASRVDFYA